MMRLVGSAFWVASHWDISSFILGRGRIRAIG